MIIIVKKNKNIKIPTYVSAGQEFIAASIATICEDLKIKPWIFGQHRCHSIYISFGGLLCKITDNKTKMKEFEKLENIFQNCLTNCKEFINHRFPELKDYTYFFDNVNTCFCFLFCVFADRFASKDSFLN